MQIAIFKDAAAGKDKPVRIPHTINGLTLNDPTDDPDDTYQLEIVSSDIAWDVSIEPLPERDGMQGQKPRRAQAIYNISGWVKAPTLAELYDKIAALEAAFDPVMAWHDDNTSLVDRGFLAYKFSVPTADTANYSGGLIPCVVYVQSVRKVVPVQTTFEGYQARFEVTLRAVDPRIYLDDDAETADRTGNGTITADNSLATYPSWPIVDIEFTTGASSDITIVRTSPTYGLSTAMRTVELEADNLSDSAGKTLTIDFQAHTATYADGTDKIAALKPTSKFWEMMPDSQTITIANAPSDAVITVTWVRAFV